MPFLPRVASSIAPLGALLAFVVAPGSQAQSPGERGVGAKPRAFVTVTPVAQLRADLDAGGDMSATGVLTRMGMVSPVTSTFSAGFTLAYDYNDYDFSDSGLVAPNGPWKVVQRIGISTPLGLRSSENWRFGFTPSFDTFRENGADWGDSLSYGATVSATREFGEGRRLGIGVGVFRRPEETAVFPFIAVDWPLTQRLRLTTPLAAGPTGPAGLELRYRFDAGWEAGVGAAYRSYRFRLDEAGPVPDGIGEEEGVPVFLRVSRVLGPRFSLDLYAGAIFGGRLTVEDSDGDKIDRSDFDPAPLLGVSVSARF